MKSTYRTVLTLSLVAIAAVSIPVQSFGAEAVQGDLQSESTVYALPEARTTTWNPGLPGGIPTCNRVFATIEASSFGAGSSDAREMVQQSLTAAGAEAIASGAGQVVLLSVGTFHVSGPLSIPSRVVLRGAGPDLTRLVATGDDHPVIVMGESLSPHPSIGAVDLVADGIKGAHSVQVANAAGFAAGQLVYLDELTDNVRSLWNPNKHPPGAGRNWFCREDRPLAQILEIEEVTGSRITFKTPLHIDFRRAQSAQLSRFDVAPVRQAGLEELRVSSGRNGNIQINHAAYSWVKHVESDDSYFSCISLRQSYRCEVRDSYLHDSCYYNNGGMGYGIDLTFASSDNLIENNISIRFNKVINCRASGGGNVIAYNYTDDGAMNSAPNWIETGLQASHYPTPHFELFEGNYTFNMDGDFTEGNAIYITFFRNQASGIRRNTPRFLHDTQNRRMAGAMKGHYWYNFVGNVLGCDPMKPKATEGWVYECAYPWESESLAVWRIGYWDQDHKVCDEKVGATMLRDGNFDYVSASVHWHGRPGFKGVLPDSLYLSGKPAFFGKYRWPWVDPLGGTKTYVLPAKARYDSGKPNELAAAP